MERMREMERGVEGRKGEWKGDKWRGGEISGKEGSRGEE